MKKSLFIAGLAMVTGLTLNSCGGGKQDAATVEEQATELTEEIKSQAIELFSSVKFEHGILMNDVEVLPEGVRVLPVKYFVPLDWADKAQTLEQKSALLGCYTVDAQFDKIVYGKRNETEARHAVITRLIAEANLAAESLDFESLSNLPNEEYIAAIDNFTLSNFENALENNQADNHVVMALYSLVELTLDQEYVNEQLGEYDQMAMIQDMKSHEEAMRNVAALIELLQPYYESLDSLNEVVEKIKAVLDAEDEAAQDVAYLEYNRYIKNLRGRLNASLDE